MDTADKSWKLKSLLLCHILIALLFATLFWPYTKVYWEMLDVAFFKWVNGSLRGNPNWQIFWAMANHRLADWVEDIFILGFFIAHIRSLKKDERKRGIAELVFCVLLIALILLFVNRMLFREYLRIPRESPTLLVDSSVRLSKEITWMSIKDGSSKSFPGDHGTTALLFAASFAYLANWRLGLIAIFYSAFLCMPRLITGAHWLSDVLVGSGSITLFFLGWSFCTPLKGYATDLIEKCFDLPKKIWRKALLRKS